MCEKHSIIEFYRNFHWYWYWKLPKFYLPSRWLVTKCSRRCERDFAEWEIHKGSWKDMKSLTLNGGRSVWFLYFINSELGIVDCFQFHIPLFHLSSNILFVGSLLDWVNITMCVSHLLPWVLSGQSLYEIMQRFFLLLLSGQSLYKIILRFFYAPAPGEPFWLYRFLFIKVGSFEICATFARYVTKSPDPLRGIVFNIFQNNQHFQNFLKIEDDKISKKLS